MGCDDEPLGCLTVMGLTAVWVLFTSLLAGIIQESAGALGDKSLDDRYTWYALVSEAVVLGLFFLLNRTLGRKKGTK